jgi:3-hydroxyacyl-CoA dehydrogenase/enoyl-CoA hydratase/3-hydroxybutyryl-CoA epimerase
VDASVYGLLRGGSSRRKIARKDIQDRLVFTFLNEAVTCLQESVLRSPRDGDVGAIFGLGFPPFLGGPFRYLDSLGAAAAVGTLERLASQHGPRFQPATMLVDVARDGRRFHASA